MLPTLRGRVYSRLPRIVYDIDDDYYQTKSPPKIKLFIESPTHIFKVIAILQTATTSPRSRRKPCALGGPLRKINRAFYDNPANREYFIGFFKQGSGLTHVARFLNLYGVLGRYLPAWGKIVGLLQHDLFHIYPVDDHILMVLRNMRRLAMDAHSHELPVSRR